jgi:uncharacterized protein (TIGR04376 family)
MGLFDDVSRFLEERLDEFLRNNPHLELQALEEQLQGQEADASRLLADLQRQEQQLKDDILGTAREVQTWHGRIEKAIAAKRPDLVKPAQEREATLLRQGNHLWGQMKGVQERSTKTQELISQIQQRRKELKVKVEEARVQANAQAKGQPQDQKAWQSTSWSPDTAPERPKGQDDLDDAFRRWEMEAELEQLKRKLGK